MKTVERINELRSVIDQGKKDIKSGIIISISTFEDKVGVAVGVTKELTSKYDAVKLVKIASETLGGKGGAVSYTHLTLPTKRIV